MTIKSILAIFKGSGEEMPMLDMACDLAIKHQAQLKVLHVLPDPKGYVGYYGGETIVASVERENKEILEKARNFFKEFTDKHSLPVLAESEKPPTRHASISIIHRIGNIEPIVAEEGRFSDLILLHRMPRDKATNDYEGALTAALFDTARPILLLPGVKLALPLDHTVAIAWKNSKEAARAMQFSLPFLTQAEKVYVLIGHASGDPIDLADKERITIYLALHGANAQFILVDGEEDMASMLVQRAKELKAGLLVMGGYGRSRMREMIFGGVTEHVLDHADIPVLMAH